MLLQISIQNFILIEKANLNFGPGLNVVTGETGAGKSIFLAALGATFGEKISLDQILPGKETFKITTTFAIGDYLEVKTLLDEMGLDYDDDLLTLRREITRDGKSKCYVNDMVSRVGHLKQLAQLLIDIHGQHQNQYLFNVRHHGKTFDYFCQNEELLESYREVYEHWYEKKKELTHLIQKEKELIKERDFLTYTIEELEKGIIKEEEYQELKSRLHRLEHSEKLSVCLNSLDTTLSSTLIPQLDKGLLELESLRDLQEHTSPIKTRLLEAKLSLEEARSALYPYLDNTADVSPLTIDEVNETLAKVERLKKKYRKTIAELTDLLGESKEKLEFLENVDYERHQLQQELAQSQKQVLHLAARLHQSRVARREGFVTTMHRELSYLGMGESKVNVSIVPQESEDGLAFGGKNISLNEEGFDQIEFLYAPTVKAEYKKLKDIASGGEISRFMLALKSILSVRAARQTMVFDEIDTGIGGHTAIHVGKKIKSLSQARQLLVITHLPQIAKHSTRHFRVEKINLGEDSTTLIKELSATQKVEEISRMLSGEQTNPEHLKFAQRFIQEA